MRASPLLSLHAQRGARLAPDGSATAVLTYGDVPGEYRAGRESALLFDATQRGLVRVAGSDAAAFLHRILANHVKALAVGAGNRNLLLTGKGKVVHAFDLVRSGEAEFLASTPPGDAGRLVQDLDVYVFSEDLSLTDASEENTPLELTGPRAAEIVCTALDVEPPRPGDGAQQGLVHVVLETPRFGSVALTTTQVAGGPGLRVSARPDRTVAVWDALLAAGAAPGGLVAWDSLRAEHVVGAFGRDVTEDVYPQEARLDDAFSLDKGCYIGQEVVAKIDTYGGLNKRLHLLRVSHDEPVPAGTRLVKREGDEARDLGLVTTWAYSFAEDGGVVLAYVKRKHQAPGTQFELIAAGADAALGTATLRT